MCLRLKKCFLKGKTMQYIDGIEHYQNTKPTAITLGKFDGLHQGHELLIERVIHHQKESDVDGVVFAFDMSPLYKKLGKEPDFLLTNRQKAKRLEGRISYFVDCPFEESISRMSAMDFISEVLVKRFHAKYIIVGTDFRFGFQKQGDYKMLQQYGDMYGYQVEVIEKKVYNGQEISSTYIKQELQKGNEELVDLLLGYKYSEIKKTF